MNPQRLFVASCISIGTAAMVFAIRGDVAGPMSAAFHITNEQMGMVFSPAFFAFTLAIFTTGNLIDIVGMRVLHSLSAIGFILGVALVTLAPRPVGPVPSLFAHPGTTMLFIGFFLFGLSHGLVEGVINPLLATLYSTEKTKRIVSTFEPYDDNDPPGARWFQDREADQVFSRDTSFNGTGRVGVTSGSSGRRGSAGLKPTSCISRVFV